MKTVFPPLHNRRTATTELDGGYESGSFSLAKASG